MLKTHKKFTNSLHNAHFLPKYDIIKVPGFCPPIREKQKSLQESPQKKFCPQPNTQESPQKNPNNFFTHLLKTIV
jgi:hypothetical protein